MKEEITQQEGLVMALALCKIQCSEETANLIIMLVNGIKEHGGEFSIKHIAEIQTANKKLYAPAE